MAEKYTEPSVAQAANTAVSTNKRAKKSSKSSSGTKKAVNSKNAAPSPFVSPSLRQQMIAEAAYYLAERRGFIAGYELEDWLAAESGIGTGRSS